MQNSPAPNNPVTPSTAPTFVVQQSTPAKKNNFLKYAIIIILILLGLVGAYYTGMKGYKVSIQVPNEGNAIPTNAIIQAITPTKAVTNPQISVKADVNQPAGGNNNGNNAGNNAGNNNPAPAICTLVAGAKSNLYNSAANKLCFLYARQGSASVPPEAITAGEVETKIYVYPLSMQRANGQSIEVFQKAPADTLEQAITKKFLNGINANDCFVKNRPLGNLANNFVKATIGYPIPANADAPNFTFGEQCPENYKESNGIAYFLMDKNHPDRFFYFSIGQYAIEAETGNQNKLWQDTLQVY
jgi:hypothetical protein